MVCLSYKTMVEGRFDTFFLFCIWIIISACTTTHLYKNLQTAAMVMHIDKTENNLPAEKGSRWYQMKFAAIPARVPTKGYTCRLKLKRLAILPLA
jgi:hypothetical protein